MSETSIPVGLLDTIIAITAGAIFTLVGIIYWKIRGQIDDLEASVAELESRIIEITRDIDTAHIWMFGRKEDPTNGGIASEIEDGFDGAKSSRDEIEERLESVIDTLHDEDELEFDRDDLDD